MRLEEYLTESGDRPFGKWFISLNAQAAAKVTTALIRLENGNRSNVKSVGDGIYEFKIDYGPGYRIYFAYDGQKLIILLAGGIKKRQQADIDSAKSSWQDYKQRKRKRKGGTNAP